MSQGPHGSGAAESDVELLHVVPDRAVEVQLCPVVRVHALAGLLFDAAGPLGPPLLVQQAADGSQGAHRDEDHRRGHAWEHSRREERYRGKWSPP